LIQAKNFGEPSKFFVARRASCWPAALRAAPALAAFEVRRRASEGRSFTCEATRLVVPPACFIASSNPRAAILISLRRGCKHYFPGAGLRRARSWPRLRAGQPPHATAGE